MKDCKLKWKRLDPRAKKPTVANPGEDLGYDLYSIEDVWIPVGEKVKVHTGVSAVAYVNGEPFGLLYQDRSRMADLGIMVSGGVIDPGYRGELEVMLTNVSGKEDYFIEAGDKIIQMIPTEVLTGDVEETDDLGESKRGGKGFGSSGK